MTAVARDYREAALSPADRGMLEFCEKLTLTPSRVAAEDLDGLRRLGFDDAAIHDVVQVTALFNYYDRLADGLGIDPEPDWEPRQPDW